MTAPPLAIGAEETRDPPMPEEHRRIIRGLLWVIVPGALVIGCLAEGWRAAVWHWVTGR